LQEQSDGSAGDSPSSGDKIAAIGLALALVLCIIRAQFIGLYGGVLRAGGRMFLAFFDDLLYVAVLTAVLLALDRGVRSWPGKSVWVRRAWLAVAVFSVLAGLLNSEVLPIFGRPFTYQWLYYSDFLQGQDAQNAIRWFLSFDLAAVWAATLIGFFAAAWVFRILIARVARPAKRAVAVGVAVYLAGAGAYFLYAGAGWNRARIENPVVTFATSVIRAPQIASFLDTPAAVGPQDFAPAPPALAALAARSPSDRLPRNVLLLVLETTPASQLAVFGGPPAATPELTRAAGQAAVFENIYAQSPATESSTVSLLLSLYPWLSYRTVTREHPALTAPSLSSELAARGYRTGYFNSSDLRYAGIGNFIANRGFDRIRGYREIRCARPELLDHNNHWENNLDGIDDACTVEALIDWIREPSNRPFFGMLWTMMTHLPYFPPEPEADLDPKNSIRNRYLNALHYEDQVLGRLFHALAESGLADSTLVVVVGDHGESFGTHGHWSHGSMIYDEDVHVPLLFIQPGRFHGERHPEIGGLIDVAPTIFDLLGLPPSPEWQGRSLFRTDRTERTYFFAPHSNYYLGFRERNLYYIDNVWQNRFEVYDLAKDPTQLHDLAKTMPEKVRVAKQRLTAWVQYQDRLYRSLFALPLRPDAVAQSRAAASEASTRR